jgi:hypothetical protein
VLATIPTDLVTSPFWFLLKVVGGAAGLILVGLFFYFRSARQVSPPATDS